LSLLGYSAAYFIVYTVGFRSLLRLVRCGPGAATPGSHSPIGREGATIKLLRQSADLDGARES
jgi:hypothetical protein